MKKVTTLVLLFFVCLMVRAQQNRLEICIDFPVSSTRIDTTFANNAMQELQMVQFLSALKKDNTTQLKNVTFRGVTSPDGNCALNTQLAKKRLTTLKKWIRSQVAMPDSIVHYEDVALTWADFKDIISHSDFPQKDTIVSILNQPAPFADSVCSHLPDYRMLQLKKLDGGKVWKQLNQRYFSRMRRACVVITTNQNLVQNFNPIIPVNAQKPDSLVIDTVLPPRVQPDTLIADTIPAWTRQLTLKTNALFWAVGMANAAVDIDLAEHWSLSIPVFYSAWDYFVNDIKFRAIGLQPEVRYWIKDTNQDGWFVGAHLGMAYWNVAVNGAYRYQDRNRAEPALGGGLGFGYRMPISKNGKWKVEFALGVGVYHAPYDKFNNVPNGQLVESGNYIYWGFDQAAVSFSYTFDLKKKGGKQ